MRLFQNAKCGLIWSYRYTRGLQRLMRRTFVGIVDPNFRVADDVRNALSHDATVVALESTIITHGMPYPDNLRTAEMVEEIVRSQNAVPATVGVGRGCLCVGLNKEELTSLASGEGKPIKVAKRDLPYVLSQRLSGGTTVSATMFAAERAGISVFVTGGVGGVHRGAEHSFDISSDLTELGQTRVAVVSAGVKSILDIPKTLEYLETQSVPVVTVGPTSDFPAFFCRKSGFKSPYHVTTPEEAALLIDSSWSLGSRSGILLAVPIPEEHEADGKVIEEAIYRAQAEASLIESVLMYALPVWWSSCCKKEKAALNRVTRYFERMIQSPLTDWPDSASKRTKKLALNIMGNPDLALAALYNLQHRGHLRSVSCRTNRLLNTFIPASIRLFNSKNK